MNLEKDLSFFERLIHGLAAEMGSRFEIVLHDLSHPPEHTVVAIENGYITGRKIGDGASEVVLEALKTTPQKDHFQYLTKTKDGHILKSSAILLFDDDGENAIGMLGINFDITNLLLAESIIREFTEHEDALTSVAIPTNVNDLLDSLIEESYRLIGKPVATMTKEDKIRAIQYLDQKGALLIKKSSDKVAAFYDISKYTLYNYLGLGEEKKELEEENG